MEQYINKDLEMWEFEIVVFLWPCDPRSPIFMFSFLLPVYLIKYLNYVILSGPFFHIKVLFFALELVGTGLYNQ